jgi:transposase InsO family protein
LRQRLLRLAASESDPPLRTDCQHERPGQLLRQCVVESFFHNLKVESIHGEPLMHPEALRRRLFETIEIEYNRIRRYSALGYISPDVFEASIAT